MRTASTERIKYPGPPLTGQSCVSVVALVSGYHTPWGSTGTHIMYELEPAYLPEHLISSSTILGHSGLSTLLSMGALPPGPQVWVYSVLKNIPSGSLMCSQVQIFTHQPNILGPESPSGTAS